MSGYVLLLSTAPNPEVAASIARELVERRLAACVNILPGIVSIYRWQGAVEQDQEVLLYIKTTQECFEPLSAALHQLHPYQLPELIQIPITSGSPAYLNWISESVSRSQSEPSI